MNYKKIADDLAKEIIDARDALMLNGQNAKELDDAYDLAVRYKVEEHLAAQERPEVIELEMPTREDRIWTRVDEHVHGLDLKGDCR